jgi:hypothetical protein
MRARFASVLAEVRQGLDRGGRAAGILVEACLGQLERQAVGSDRGGVGGALDRAGQLGRAPCAR